MFVAAGCALVVVLSARNAASGMPDLVNAHLLMGGVFGGFHLAYGLYLMQTREKSGAPAV
jgi:hypothetical protein